ncbi:hypothetical protein HanRHA438_Chr16g0785531 [Helianthus annuus]|nr:hypothetical protein HanIR_Chr05g0241341 [Helianthus annuus]KAJ0838123.1 hypothetical protein HanRHA438_Chr16g0785531 [Helianthus annuus]
MGRSSFGMASVQSLKGMAIGKTSSLMKKNLGFQSWKLLGGFNKIFFAAPRLANEKNPIVLCNW